MKFGDKYALLDYSDPEDQKKLMAIADSTNDREVKAEIHQRLIRAQNGEGDSDAPLFV